MFEISYSHVSYFILYFLLSILPTVDDRVAFSLICFHQKKNYKRKLYGKYSKVVQNTLVQKMVIHKSKF